MSSPLSSAKVLPWGRLVLQTKSRKASLSDHHDLRPALHHQIEGQRREGGPTWSLKTIAATVYLTPLVYKLEILPSGLTKKNEELHARLSAAEMSVADRTRKRSHEETQCTQSPSKPVPSPPRSRKKLRVVTISQHETAESESQEPRSRAAGKKRHRTDVPAPDSKLAKLQKENELKTKQLTKTQELAASREENEALKKAHEEELKKERDDFKRTVEDVLTDPRTPNQARTAVELDAKIQELRRKFKDEQERQDVQRQQDRSKTTPPSKKQLIEIERKNALARRLMVMQRERVESRQRELQREKQQAEEEMKLTEIITMDLSISSGSSQSQDSIDAGRVQSDRRSSHLSAISNEHSEPSPGDLPLTLDEETKSGDTSQGRPPLFNTYGASAPTGDNARPASLSAPSSHLSSLRDQVEDEESKGQQDATEDEETKGNN
ncbi:uncharacterized protein KRP23_3658 [Phytophthora ramorum]|uniref:uncharacterized protein n=1 Tax=Phytophthora ramorum TaxID=164328 RepID=UPI0030A74898|nr:hypothetical protein KRP23_3658 [Phytophthora ramorum]